MQLLKKAIAEFVGTMILVLFACGVAVWTYANVVATSLAFGLVIVAMAYSIGNVSGCHINPAVSLAMAMRKEISWREFAVYVAAQILGGLVGAGLLAMFLGSGKRLGGNEVQALLTSAYNNEGLGLFLGLIAEIILTFVFVIAVLGATDKKHHDGRHAGIVIGLALTLVHLLGLGLTGTSANPARSIGPAVFQALFGRTASLQQIWIWIIGPMAGGALAAVVYTAFTTDSKVKVHNKSEELQ